MCDFSFSESNVELFNGEYPCLVFLQAMRDMHKSGLVLSTPSSQFKGNSCVVSSFLLKQVCTLDITVFYVVMFFEEWH